MESLFHAFKAQVVRGDRFAYDRALRQVLCYCFRYHNCTCMRSALVSLAG